MRPVMKSSPWPRRLQHLPLAMALVCISVVMTKPKTLIGLPLLYAPSLFYLFWLYLLLAAGSAGLAGAHS